MRPEWLKRDAHLTPDQLSKCRQNHKFEKGAAEFKQLYQNDPLLQRFELPLNFEGFSTPAYWNFQKDPLV